jgi:hypothetical protein
VTCDIDPDQLPPSQSYDHQNVQLDKADGRNHKQIHRGDVRRMVAQKGAPGLTTRAASLGHVLGNGRLRDRKAEPEQFAVNPRRTPKHILNAHLSDQCPQTRIDWWPASQVPGFPAPIAAKTGAMPSHQRLGSDGRHYLHDRWKPPIQLEEEQPIAVRELDPTVHLALKDNQLTSERGILSLQPADRPERRNQQPQKEEEQCDHRGRRYVIPSSDQTDEVFGIHRS